MTRNMGTTDRVARLVMGLVALAVAPFAEGWALTVLLVVAAAMLATSAAGYCPLYVPFGITTRRGSRTA